jgi:uncharacterized protein
MENEIIEFTGVQRFDRSPMETRFDTTPEGFLQGTAIVTRTGVFPYMNADGSMRYELRHPDDVFQEKSMETLKRKPIANDHPKEGIITSKLAKKYVVGSTGSTVNQDGRHLSVDIVVTDDKAIRAVEGGKKELSLGYKCDTIPEIGEYEGVKYTHRQRNIVVNHCALVQKARAGSVAKIRLDGAETPIDIEDTKENLVENENLKTINLDSVDYQAEAKVIEVLQAHKAKAEEIQVKLDTAITEKAKVDAEKDAIKERLDSITAELEALKANHVDADKVKALIQARVELEAFAVKAGVEVKNDMDDVAIKKAVVQKLAPTVDAVKLDSADYLNVRFEIVKEDFAEIVKKAGDAQARSVNAVKNDSADNKEKTYEEKRKDYVAGLRNASKAK